MSTNQLAAIGASIVIVAALAIGLFLLGSPTEERSRRLDEQRVDDLRQLTRAINSSYSNTDSLPGNLANLVDGRELRLLPTDPETNQNYDYEIVDSETYRLCAEFSRNTDDEDRGDFWSHAIGRQCFSFKAQSDR